MHLTNVNNLTADKIVAWQLMQYYSLQNDDQRSIVSWNVFHEILQDKEPQNLIWYGPFYLESPTNPDVVETSE